MDFLHRKCETSIIIYGLPHIHDRIRLGNEDNFASALFGYGTLPFSAAELYTQLRDRVYRHLQFTETPVTLDSQATFNMTVNAYIVPRLLHARLHLQGCIQNFRISESFKENRPAGLQKYLFDSETIYSKLPELNEKMKKSWYEFDHHYSDDCFRETIPLIFEAAFKNRSEKRIFDIGGNTGKFERACLEYDRDCTVTMIDLKENIEAAQKNFNTERCKFFAANILKDELPQISGAVFMSQFLDCFSKKQILKILNKVAKHSDKDTKIFILEPFIDKQQFEGAAYALSHISMYFTCMANGNSKMYNESEMKEIIEKSDLKLERVYQNIGKYDYTLLECTKR